MKNIRRVVLLAIFIVGCAPVVVSQADPAGNKLAEKRTANGSEKIDLGGWPAANPAGEQFIIGTGDVLAINVWKESEVSRVIPVRSDGRISLPLVGEIQASGHTPKQLESDITLKLRDYVSEPDVTVIVQEIKSQKFNVLGMVMKPGSYELTNSTTVLDAIAIAGGFRDFAKKKDIYVLRAGTDGTTSRIPFNYKEVIKGKNPGQNVKLEPRDTIYVP